MYYTYIYLYVNAGLVQQFACAAAAPPSNLPRSHCQRLGDMEPTDALFSEASGVMALPELVDDLVGEILLRVPPGEPACLVRASLVCKSWRHAVSDPAFRRRYRAFHRARLRIVCTRGSLDSLAGEFV